MTEDSYWKPLEVLPLCKLLRSSIRLTPTLSVMGPVLRCIACCKWRCRRVPGAIQYLKQAIAGPLTGHALKGFVAIHVCVHVAVWLIAGVRLKGSEVQFSICTGVASQIPPYFRFHCNPQTEASVLSSAFTAWGCAASCVCFF